MLPALEREHDVLAPTLAGHAGGPPVVGRIDESVLADEVERSLDAAGWDTAHVVGNSLGGYVALQLAARGRARVVALAPAGGFAKGDESYRETLAYHESMLAAVKAAAPHADAILASPKSRRRATRYTATNFEHIPVDLLAHQIRGAAACDAGLALIEHGHTWAGRSRRPGSSARCGSSGGPPIASCRGRGPRLLPRRLAPRRPTGSSSSASRTCPSSTSRSRPHG